MNVLLEAKQSALMALRLRQAEHGPRPLSRSPIPLDPRVFPSAGAAWNDLLFKGPSRSVKLASASARMAAVVASMLYIRVTTGCAISAGTNPMSATAAAKDARLDRFCACVLRLRIAACVLCGQSLPRLARRGCATAT